MSDFISAGSRWPTIKQWMEERSEALRIGLPVEHFAWSESDLLQRRFVEWGHDVHGFVSYLVPRRLPWTLLLWLRVKMVPLSRYWCGIVRGHGSKETSERGKRLGRGVFLDIPIRCQHCGELYQYTSSLRWFRWRR